jgi:hypothetical protein
MALKRSNIEFGKRVFLDRLTVDAQPLLQAADIDQGPGDDYIYGGVYDPFDFGIGADCSGCSGNVIDAAINGAAGMSWKRLYSTETFPGPFQGLFWQTSQDDLLSGNYPIKVCIQHGGGGPNSHMNTWIDGWLMESNGSHGTCTLNHGAIGQDSDFWNDFWVSHDTITDDINYRQTMGYPRGLDYAGGRPSGADLQAAGISFVCRYLSDGGAGLPGKQLLPDEFKDLLTNGIAVVFNWETTADFMLGGQNAGSADATTALNYVRSLPNGPAQPVVYFSCDFDEAPEQQDAINAYLTGAGSVLGGPNHVGIYGAYYVGKRALDAGACKYFWQTEAWSGFPHAPHVDSRANIVQRNRIGYQIVSGVQCDINEAHSPDFGQWMGSAQPSPVSSPIPRLSRVPSPIPPPSPVPSQNIDYQRLIYEQLCGPINPNTGYGGGWPQLGQNEKGDNLCLVDAVARLAKTGDRRKKVQAVTVRAKTGGEPKKRVATTRTTPDGGTRSTRGKEARRSPQAPAKPVVTPG